MSPASHSCHDSPALAKMAAAGLPDRAIASFALHLDRFLGGETGTLGRDLIDPAGDLDDVETMAPPSPAELDLLDRVVVIKLNGGLGTSMGLERAKSLVEIRDGATFLDLIVRQILALRHRHRRAIPLLLMNSFRTADDTAKALESSPEIALDDLPLGFLQSMVPKILAGRGTPVEWPADPELEWCPPGHGDLFGALAADGLLDRLLGAGYEIAFASNSDNLGAVLEPRLLSFMARCGADFVMEVADRTPADRKGGHLCRLKDGHLALRELAQCPADEIDEFQDTLRYRFFNTNNIWFSLPSLAELLDRHGGVLPLATIVNRKHVDPRDSSSPGVVQLETAMGAAISLFGRAAAVRVPRQRFSPVKNTNDLLAVRSDAFEITADGRVVLVAERSGPPTVDLDHRFYRRLDDFEGRFPAGPPSLLHCTSLTVRGDVTFGAGVAIEGEVAIRGGDEPSRIPNGAVLRSEHRA